MKRLFALLLASAVMATASAQDKQIFNHLSVGATVGFDGVGLELAAPVTPILQLRAGYSIFLPTKLTVRELDMLPETITINGTKRELRNVAPVTAHFNFGAPKVLLDIFPGRNTSFHFTVGAYFANPKLVSADFDLSKTLLPNEYASTYIELQDGNIDSCISSDKNGFIHADYYGNAVRPYLGLGFGRGVNLDRRVSVTFDMGLVYWGTPKIESYDYSISGYAKPVNLSSSLIDYEDEGLIDAMSKVSILPVLKLNIFVRLF